MAILKQKTVSEGRQKQTVVLKQLVNTMNRGGRHMYVIEDKDTGARLVDPMTNKREAKQEFRRTVSQIQTGMQSAANDSSGFGRDDDGFSIGLGK